jgi:hypothetical protein
MKAMEITKELVLYLYERKDPKRKRMLFELYQDLFTANYSARFLADVINKKLSISVVTLYDIKYIRSKMKQWTSQQNKDAGNTKVETSAKAVKAVKWPVSEPEPYVKPFEKFKR